MNLYLTSQDEAKLIKPVIIKYNHTGVKCAIQRIWSVKGKHNVRHTVHLVGKGLIGVLVSISVFTIQHTCNTLVTRFLCKW